MGAINGSHLWVKVSAVACPSTCVNDIVGACGHATACPYNLTQHIIHRVLCGYV